MYCFFVVVQRETDSVEMENQVTMTPEVVEVAAVVEVAEVVDHMGLDLVA